MSLSNDTKGGFKVDNQKHLNFSVIGPSSTFQSLANVRYDAGTSIYGGRETATISATYLSGKLVTGGPLNGLLYSGSGGLSNVSTNVFVTENGLSVLGDLSVAGDFNVIGSNNVIISDPILEIGNGAAAGSNVGLILDRPSGNVLFAYMGQQNELVMSYTDSSASSYNNNVVPDESKTLDVRVVGNVHVTNDFYASNLSGNASNLTSLTAASQGTYGGAGDVPIITIDSKGYISSISTIPVSEAAVPSLQNVVLSGNSTSNTVEFNNSVSFVTTGNVGIANSNPQHALSINGKQHFDGDIVVESTGNAVFIGTNGTVTANAVSIGYNTGGGIRTVSIGEGAGETSQLSNSIAIGLKAGSFGQRSSAIAVGELAGTTSQNHRAIAIGSHAGETSQKSNALAVGVYAGVTSQGVDSIAIGTRAGLTDQNTHAIAIGHEAGSTSQGTNSIAIGYKAASSTQNNNSIVLNASGVDLNTVHDGAFYVSSVRHDGDQTANLMTYNTTTKEVTESAIILNGSNVGINVSSPSATLEVAGNVLAWSYSGNGANITSTTDAVPGFYGGESNIYGSNVSRIEIGSDGRVKSVTNVFIQTPTGGVNLADVSNVGNVTANTIRFTNTDTSFVTSSNIGVANALPEHTISVGDGTTEPTIHLYGNVDIASIETRIRVGKGASTQGDGAVAIGSNVGGTQGVGTVALGSDSGVTQADRAVAIGSNTGVEQGLGAVAIGFTAGSTSQSANAIAMGTESGVLSQGSNAVALGYTAGYTEQGADSIAIGYNAGATSQGIESIAIGKNTTGGVRSVALGSDAGSGTETVAVGFTAGNTNQGLYSVAVGSNAGVTSQGSNAVAIGYRAGETSQHANTVILNASGQALNSVAVDSSYLKPIRFGQTSQAANLVASNLLSGELITSSLSTLNGNVGIGILEPTKELDVAGNIAFTQFIYGNASQLSSTTDVSEGVYGGDSNSFGSNLIQVTVNSDGRITGITNVFTQSTLLTLQQVTEFGNISTIDLELANLVTTGNVAFGTGNNYTPMNTVVVASGGEIHYNGDLKLHTDGDSIEIGSGVSSGGIGLGFQVHETGASANSIAIGTSSGKTTQGSGAISIGSNVGTLLQGSNSIAIGVLSGDASQNVHAIAIGREAGKTLQGSHSIALGDSAGRTTQLHDSIAIGSFTGYLSQASNAVAMGYEAGYNTQGSGAVALGKQAGKTLQKVSAVAIGNLAGQVEQGSHSIAIGNSAGKTSQHDRSIVINATGSDLNSVAADSTSISPIRDSDTQDANVLATNRVTKEIVATQLAAHGSNIGIGNVNSVYKLTVAGNVRTEGELTATRAELYGSGARVDFLASEGAAPSAVIELDTSDLKFKTGGDYTMNLTSYGDVIVTNNVIADYFTGNASNLVSVTDAAPGVYGGSANVYGSNIATITVNSDGRITEITNTFASTIRTIQEVTDFGNVTSNVVQFVNQSTGFVTLGNVAIGTGNSYTPSKTLHIGGADTNAHYGLEFGGNVMIHANGNKVSIGSNVASAAQSVAIGSDAASINPAAGAVAIGFEAGKISQGSHAVAIGHSAGLTSQADNSIIINASGSELSPGTNSALFIDPVRSVTSGTTFGVIGYNSTTKEVVVSNIQVASNGLLIDVPYDVPHPVEGSTGQIAYFDNTDHVGGTDGFTFNSTTNTLSIEGNVNVGGDLIVDGNVIATKNLMIEDPIIQIGNNATQTTTTGIVFDRPVSGNVMIGYLSTEGSQYLDHVVLAHTSNSAHDETLVPDTTKELPLKVIGNIYSTGNLIAGSPSTFLVNTIDGRVGIGNNAPSEALDIDGNIRVTGNVVGGDTSDFGISANGNSNIHLSSNVLVGNIAISNTNPTDPLTVGTKFRVTTAGHVHADFYTGNAVNLRSTTDAAAGYYGGASNIYGSNLVQIQVGTDGRVKTVSNLFVPTPVGSLDFASVSSAGNTTSNTIEFNNTSTAFVTLSNVGIANTSPQNTLSVNGTIYNNNLVANSLVYTNSSNVLSTSPVMTFNADTGILDVDSTGGLMARQVENGKFIGRAYTHGEPVYISGTVGGSGQYEFSLTDNDDSTKMPAFGLVMTDYLENDFGYIVRQGVVPNIPTSVFIGVTPTSSNLNAKVYIGQNGKLTLARPALSSELIQNIGVIAKVTGSGVDIVIQGAGRANDVPNRLGAVDANIYQTVTIGGAAIQSHTNLHVTGNTYISSDLTSDANITAQYFTGNASNMVSLTAAAEGTYGGDSNAYGSNLTTVSVNSDGYITDISNSFVYNASNLQILTELGSATRQTITLENAESMITYGRVGVSNINPASGDLFTVGNVFRVDNQSNLWTGDNVSLRSSNIYASVSIGARAGLNNRDRAVAIGTDAGRDGQNNYSTAIGWGAGKTGQGSGAVSLGASAGETYQNAYAVAIGYAAGQTGQHARSIVLNATGAAMGTDGEDRLYAKPVRSVFTETTNVMSYNTTTGEVITSDIQIDNSNIVGNLITTTIRFDDGVAQSEIDSLTLFDVCQNGNVTDQTISFSNTTLGIITTANVGIANSSPEHMLSVGGNVYVSGQISSVGAYTGPIEATTLSFSSDPTEIVSSLTLQDICEIGSTYVGSSNVGIGTATPSTKLEVSGTITATAYAPFTGVHFVTLDEGVHAVDGTIMVSTGKVKKNSVIDTIPCAAVSTVKKQPSVLGAAAIVDGQLVVMSIGEGQVRVCEQGGKISNGDYICSSAKPGIGMRQPDDILHNYTVAKATEDCDFSGPEKECLIACTFHCG